MQLCISQIAFDALIKSNKRFWEFYKW